jgi:hypothetical protein
MAASVISSVDAIFDNHIAQGHICDTKVNDIGVDYTEDTEAITCNDTEAITCNDTEADDAKVNDNSMVIPDSDLDRFILGEIERRTSKCTSWKMLEQCFRWSRVQDYLKELGVDDNEVLVADLKRLLVKKQLNDVVYDNKAHKILRLNHNDI